MSIRPNKIHNKITTLLILLLATTICARPVTAAPGEPITVGLDIVGASGSGHPAPQDAKVPQSVFMSQARDIYSGSTAVAGFSSAGSFGEVYPGISMACYTDPHQFELAFILRTGADPDRIKFKLSNVNTVGMTDQGNLIYRNDKVEVYQHAPVAVAVTKNGSQPVHSSLLMEGNGGSAITVSDFFSRNREKMNNTRFNVVPGDIGPAPRYDFYMSKFETTNRQLLEFLNNAEANRNNQFGANMFFDKEGNVWINPEMKTNRDELFNIGKSKLLYDPDRVVGDRYYHVRDIHNKELYADYPVTGLSWYGAVKYCNWLTLRAGRGISEQCYSEGTNTWDWAPITATNWSQGFFGVGEREAWLKLKGFRLPMFKTFPNPQKPNIETNSFNEFLKAGSWNGTTNVLYGYGRNTFTNTDANALLISVGSHQNFPTPVGYFNGINKLNGVRTRGNANFFEIFDLSGNVGEWVNDPPKPGLPDARAVCGGSYAALIEPLTEEKIVEPYSCGDSGGFRPLTTYMPDEYIQINILFCFHAVVQEEKPEKEEERHGGKEKASPQEQANPSPQQPSVEHPYNPAINPGGIEYTPVQPQPGPTPPGPGPGPTPPGPGPQPPYNPTPVRTLQVNSTPADGVPISITPADIHGRRGGTTSFSRFYHDGQQVTLRAPYVFKGLDFTGWLLNGIPFSDDTTITVMMNADITVTASYGKPATYKLNIDSQNPDSDVPIAIDNPDINGKADGETSLTREYNPGEQVGATAPDKLKNHQFQYWVQNGSPVSTRPSIDVQMIADRNLTAVFLDFVPPAERHLLVDSTPANGVPIDISVEDKNGDQNGNTSFERVYDNGTTVTATAPDSFNGLDFREWLLNNRPYSSNPSVTVTLNSDLHLTAAYGAATSGKRLTVNSQNPDSGVLIDVSETDNNGDKNGETTFTRNYDTGTMVTLVAPSITNKVFKHWLRNGVEDSHDQTTTIELRTDLNMTAVYEDAPPPFVTLQVDSDNSGGGVEISIGTPDNDGNTDGTTLFKRYYDVGIPTTVTAPQTAPNGNTFAQWVLNDIPVSTNLSIDVSMLADTDLIAVYKAPGETHYTLDVKSQNPDSGVDISVSTPDINNDTDGTTAFQRTYQAGAVTTLTAPETAANGTKTFDYWLIDGSRYDTRIIDIAMYADHTVTAVYKDTEPPKRHVLTVESRNPNRSVVIQIDPPDVNGQQNGTTSFTRLYEDGEHVTLTASDPAFPGSANAFKYWEIDGTPWTSEKTVAVDMTRDITVTAVYGPVDTNPHTLTVQSQNPDSGVEITISQADTNGLSNGSTEFERVYNHGTPITATAPEITTDSNGNKFKFKHWLIGGNIYDPGNLSIDVDMVGDITITAVYEPYIEHILTVKSDPHDNNIVIAVSTPDNNGEQDGHIEFTRIYPDGQTVSLTAPYTAPNEHDVFLGWKRDGSIISTNTTFDVTLYTDVEVTAVYGPPSTYKLTVNSQNPDEKVPITISTPDIHGDTDGETTFERTYNPATDVTVTAPQTAPNGNTFVKWQDRSGTVSTNLSISVTMLSDRELTAVYGEAIKPRFLIVRSDNPGKGVYIDISLKDLTGKGGDNTTFGLTYENGAITTATAPAMAGGNNFKQWLLDGSPFSTNLSITVQMWTNHVILAKFGPPANTNDVSLYVDSENPRSGVPITVSKVDNDGLQDGDTVFTRTYTVGDTVTLTAPPQVGTNNTTFSHWELDGKYLSDQQTVSIEMLTDHKATAIFDTIPPPATLTVNAKKTDDTVVETIIGVAPADLNNKAVGTTEFERTYDYGTFVTLDAPPEADDEEFAYWERNGWKSSTNRNITVEILTNVVMTAVYGPVTNFPPEVILTVQAKGPDGPFPKWITLETSDSYGRGSGTTTFKRKYNNGTEVTVKADERHGDFRFDHWNLNGSPYAGEGVQTITFTMFTDNTITAVYVYDPITLGADAL